MLDPLAKLRALLDDATPGGEPESPGEAYERTTAWYGLAARMADLAPELLEVVEAAKRRLDAGHNDTCDRVRSSVRLCSCGASGLLAATEALDAKLEEVMR